jgi:hypothetical protein
LLDGQVGGAFHESRRPADEALLAGRRWSREVEQALGVQAPDGAGPPGRRFPGVGDVDVQAGARGREALQFGGVQQGGGAAGGVDQPHRGGAAGSGPGAGHGHQRHDARPAADQQDGLRFVRVPGEVAADRASQLQRVAGGEDLGQVRGDLAVVEPLDGQLEPGAAGG